MFYHSLRFDSFQVYRFLTLNTYKTFVFPLVFLIFIFTLTVLNPSLDPSWLTYIYLSGMDSILFQIIRIDFDH